MTYSETIDKIIDTLAQLKREILAVDAKYWEIDNDSIPMYLNGIKRLESEGLLTDTMYCKLAQRKVMFLHVFSRKHLAEWREADTEMKKDKVYEDINRSALQFTRNIEETMYNCRMSVHEAMKIGCNDFLCVFANIDVLVEKVPPSIRVEGQEVKIRVFRQDGFVALYHKMLPSLEDAGPIGDFAIPLLRFSSFLMVVCQETPFLLKAFKVIESAPTKGYTWNVSGGLQNISKDKGLGSRLMQATEALGNAYEIEKIKIMVADSARGFYSKIGMKDVDLEEDPMKLYMEKRIGVLRGRKYFTLEDIKRGADDAFLARGVVR